MHVGILGNELISKLDVFMHVWLKWHMIGKYCEVAEMCIRIYALMFGVGNSCKWI